MTYLNSFCNTRAFKAMKHFLQRSLAQITRQVAPQVIETIKLLWYVNSWVLPRDLEGKDLTSFAPEIRLDLPGIDLQVPTQLERLSRWSLVYQQMFDALRRDPQINTLHLGKPYLHNGYYPTPDAEIYAALIGDYRPAYIVEIGSGYSTRIARLALQYHGIPCKLTAVDPQPRADISNVADQVIYRVVEEVPTDVIIRDRLLLFIDSSHITRSRGDIPYLYNTLIPKLPVGTLVQVHDIYTPYDYPYIYQKRLYTEQYMLQSLLTHSSRYRVVFATHMMGREHTETMRQTISPAIGINNEYYGAAFWFEII